MNHHCQNQEAKYIFWQPVPALGWSSTRFLCCSSTILTTRKCQNSPSWRMQWYFYESSVKQLVQWTQPSTLRVFSGLAYVWCGGQCPLAAGAHWVHSCCTLAAQNVVYGWDPSVMRTKEGQSGVSLRKQTSAPTKALMRVYQRLMRRTEHFSGLKKAWETYLFKELQCMLWV